MENNLQREFIPYAEALALKELGFDEPCFGVYLYNMLKIGNYGTFSNIDVIISAPTFSQAFRFFREKYDLQSYIRFECPDVESYYDFVINEDVYDIMKDTYEEAELACLQKLIEITKKL